MSTNTDSQLPIPAGVTFVDSWQQDDPPFRVLRGTDRRIDGHDVRVGTAVIQFGDGRIDDGHIEPPHVFVDHCDRGLTAVQAREMAAVLTAAADEIERMAGCDRTTVS
jgi:hypothetical protein